MAFVRKHYCEDCGVKLWFPPEDSNLCSECRGEDEDCETMDLEDLLDSLLDVGKKYGQ